VATSALPNTAAPQFDFRPLATHYSAADLRELKKSRRSWWPMRAQLGAVVGSIALILSFVVIDGLVAVIGWLIVTTPAFVGGGLLGILASAVVVGIVVFVTYFCLRILRRDVTFGPNWQRVARLNSFAKHNGMLYRPYIRGPRYPGSIFAAGVRGVASDVMFVVSGRKIQFGNYRSSSRVSGERSHSSWGYLIIELDRSMPHMMAIARANRGFNKQSIATNVLRNQVLSLEGDFDRYFTLYAPKEYERDALYVFTPDLMALMIDRLSNFDVEIVDNWLCIYAHKPFDLTDPGTHSRLASIVQVVGRKATNQTRRYSDDRTAPSIDAVAAGGFRLRRGVAAGTIIAIVYFGLRVIASFHGF
jgi:hypothetical protein